MHRIRLVRQLLSEYDPVIGLCVFVVVVAARAACGLLIPMFVTSPSSLNRILAVEVPGICYVSGQGKSSRKNEKQKRRKNLEDIEDAGNRVKYGR